MACWDGHDMSLESVEDPPRRRGLNWKMLALDVALVVAGIAAYYIFPHQLGLITRIYIMIILVLSLDLVLGYAGIPTLGHAAMYGSGAYAAGLFAVHVMHEPLVGLLVGAAAGAVVAFLSGLLLLRATGLTLLMISIAVAQVLQELANKMNHITGGADGLGVSGLTPIFGLFRFDFLGRTGYWYAFIVLVLVFILLKVVVRSPFGLMARGIQESHARMRAIGTPVYSRLVAVYTIGGAIAGLAGALSAQTAGLVSLEVYGFNLSAEALTMLVLGGTGNLYGAIAGTVLFMIVHHIASAVDPFNWLFIIGALVLGVVFFFPGGFLTLWRALARKPERRR